MPGEKQTGRIGGTIGDITSQFQQGLAQKI
jgi:hypothetical protein